MWDEFSKILSSSIPPGVFPSKVYLLAPASIFFSKNSIELGNCDKIFYSSACTGRKFPNNYTFTIVLDSPVTYTCKAIIY